MEKIDIALALLGVIAFGITGILSHVIKKEHGEQQSFTSLLATIVIIAISTLIFAVIAHSVIIFF